MLKKNTYGKEFRLLKSNDFKALRNKPKLYSSKYLRAYYKPMAENNNLRLGLSVSKKVGNSVRRNKVKRIIKEAFRVSNFKNIPVDILFVVSPRLGKKFDNDNEKTKLLLKNEFLYILSKIIV